MTVPHFPSVGPRALGRQVGLSRLALQDTQGGVFLCRSCRHEGGRTGLDGDISVSKFSAGVCIEHLDQGFTHLTLGRKL